MTTNEFWICFLIYFSITSIKIIVNYNVFKKRKSGELTQGKFLINLTLLFIFGASINALFFNLSISDLPEIIEKKPLVFFLSLISELLLIYIINGITTSTIVASEQDKVTGRYVCNDGHVVRSRGEAMIDNWLSKNRITHEYEHQIKLGDAKIKYDWYLPEHDVYIEYWGLMQNKKYVKRRKEKEKLYAVHDKKLISINNKDIEDINTRVKEKLMQFLSIEDFEKPRICFNCGAKLDERYE
ncbi:MAG: hypothetical protein ACTSVI_14110 [Promethearchaeota archaeon]